jgi:hypothetical protein
MREIEMIAGDWKPTSDPAGRLVRFFRRGVVMQGTVLEAEISEDSRTLLFVDVTAPPEHCGEHPVCLGDLEWMDAEGNACDPWYVSDTPLGRWVIFHDDDGVERSGCVITADSPDYDRTTLSVMVIAPDHFKTHQVDYQAARWLPE